MIDREYIPFEKVNLGHPDKMADRIAGAIVDYAYSIAKNPKIAVEVLAGHGKVAVIAESSVDIPKQIVDDICNRILRPKKPLTIEYTQVAQDSYLAANQNGHARCGDNGIFKGMPVTETQKLLAIISKKMADRFDNYDGKYVIKKINESVQEYDLIVCQSHTSTEEIERLLHDIEYDFGVSFNATINPLGEWTGGIEADSGATNRKLGSDMGDSVTGGGLHGKDLSKADVSVNIACGLYAEKMKRPIYAHCAIGDEFVTFNDGKNIISEMRYKDIIVMAQKYITSLGGFEKLAESGLIR